MAALPGRGHVVLCLALVISAITFTGSPMDSMDTIVSSGFPENSLLMFPREAVYSKYIGHTSRRKFGSKLPRSNRWHQTLRDLRGGGAAGSKPGKFKKKEGIGEMGGQSNSQDRRQLSSLCLAQAEKKPLKYVIVTGGVLSGIGKGVTASSIGVLLKMMHRKPTAIKIDPYLNIDAGTMSPLEHGEVYVLEDGGETDLDLGNYERFMDVKLTNDSNLTTGKVYRSIIEAERRGEFLGKTVQVIPHVTGEIRAWMDRTGRTPIGMADGGKRTPDTCVIELGGTVGDIESMPFLEAIRELQLEVGRSNVVVVHVSLIPEIHGEQKTKPTQHSIQKMREIGIYPDVLVARSRWPLRDSARMKLSSFCNVPQENIISMPDLSNIYHIPRMLVDQGLHRKLASQLQLKTGPLDRLLVNNWGKVAKSMDSVTEEIRIALVGKYTGGSDTYHSVVKALLHASISSNQKLKILWIDSADLELPEESEEFCHAWRELQTAHGILVPGGFGQRAHLGMIRAIHYARIRRVPFLGICLGMQLAVVEFARNELGIRRADSTEFNSNLSEDEKVIIFMPEGDTENMGGTMRLGVRTTRLIPNSTTYRYYGATELIQERHRHRYEVNPHLLSRLEEYGLRFVGKDAEKGDRMEVVELPLESHPYYVATQFHPEFNTRHQRPSPPFFGLLQAAKKHKVQMMAKEAELSLEELEQGT
ncbi:hypothetical protein AAMO2058_001283400 [Amorphochlora amoebiformis]